MIQLRLTVPDDISDGVVAYLDACPGVAHLAVAPEVAVRPRGTVVFCDVSRSYANDVVEWLQQQGVHHRGAIALQRISAVVSDAAQRADESSPVSGGDVLIWEEIEAQARDDAQLTISFLVFMAIAAMIAVVGIVLDTPILIVAAMVVGPEYGPLSAACLSAARTRWTSTASALATLSVGFLVAALAATVFTFLFRVAGPMPDHFSLSEHTYGSFISHPDVFAATVAVLAGVIGMLSLTEARSNTLVGVLVSVTTIPAVSAAGVALSYGQWRGLAGSAAQLGINVIGLLVAGIVTVTVQSRYTVRRAARHSA